MIPSLRTLCLILALGAHAPAHPVLQGSEGSAWVELEGATPAQLRVVWWEDPGHNALISWSTAAATEVNRALLSLEQQTAEPNPELIFPSTRDGLFSDSTKQSGDGTKAGGVYYHHARVTGLQPDTVYYLRVESDGSSSREFHFRTAPSADTPFTLLYGGDARTEYEDRLRMNRMIAGLAASDDGILAFVHGGDYVMDGRRWEQWSLWLSHHELCTTSAGRLLPLIPARGNHDWGVLYDEVFNDLGGRGRNYGGIEIGPELALLTLNTNISAAGEQAAWMKEALPRLRADNRWLLAQYHRPLWPAVKAPALAKPLWVPLFEANDLDLAMESDGHVLKRTVPIRDGKFDPSGVTYIGEGGLGATLRRPRGNLWYLEAPGFVSTGLHLNLLEVSSVALTIRTLGPPPVGELDPVELDLWTLPPREKAAPE